MTHISGNHLSLSYQNLATLIRPSQTSWLILNHELLWSMGQLGFPGMQQGALRTSSNVAAIFRLDPPLGLAWSSSSMRYRGRSRLAWVPVSRSKLCSEALICILRAVLGALGPSFEKRRSRLLLLLLLLIIRIIVIIIIIIMIMIIIILIIIITITIATIATITTIMIITIIIPSIIIIMVILVEDILGLLGLSNHGQMFGLGYKEGATTERSAWQLQCHLKCAEAESSLRGLNKTSGNVLLWAWTAGHVAL